jgi:hypothetical protein
VESSDKKRIPFYVDEEKHQLLSLIKSLDGYKSLQEMIDQAVDEKFGKRMLEVKAKALK